MTIPSVPDPKTPIGEILKAAEPDGLVLESEDQGRFAIIPLDEDLLDFLIERNPKFLAVCQQIRARMDAGQFLLLRRSYSSDQQKWHKAQHLALLAQNRVRPSPAPSAATAAGKQKEANGIASPKPKLRAPEPPLPQ